MRSQYGYAADKQFKPLNVQSTPFPKICNKMKEHIPNSMSLKLRHFSYTSSVYSAINSQSACLQCANFPNHVTFNQSNYGIPVSGCCSAVDEKA